MLGPRERCAGDRRDYGPKRMLLLLTFLLCSGRLSGVSIYQLTVCVRPPVVEPRATGRLLALGVGPGGGHRALLHRVRVRVRVRDRVRVRVTIRAMVNFRVGVIFND